MKFAVNGQPFTDTILSPTRLEKEWIELNVPEFTFRQFVMPDPGENIWHNFGDYNHQVSGILKWYFSGI